MTSDILSRLMNRKSTNDLVEPIPSKEDIKEIIQFATTVPDHGRLSPYSFHFFSGDSRQKFGKSLLASAREKNTELSDSVAKKIEAKADRAPMLIAIVCNNKKCKIPKWEQEATTACAAFAICQALDLKGFGAVWKSSNYDAGASMKALLNMEENDSLLGWINVGSTKKEHFEQKRELKDPEQFTHYY